MSELAEENLLGALVLEPGQIGGAVNALSEEMFTSPERRAVFHALVDMYWGKEPVDAVTLVHKLPDLSGYIMRLAESTLTTSHSDEYIRIVQDDWQLSNLQKSLERIMLACGGAGDMVERLENLCAEHRKMLEGRKTDGVYSFAEVFEKFRTWLNSEEDRPRHTGFQGLDSFTGGCREGTMLTLAGRPGCGKSDYALNLALRMAKRGIRVIYFTKEISDVDLMRRVVSHLLKINSSRIRDKRLTQEEEAAVDQLTEAISKWEKLKFAYKEEISVGSIRQAVQRYRPGVVIVDHIGLLERPQAANSYREIGILSNRLKQLALAEKICVVALSQMNRQVENRAGGEPNLSDLRESGDLEQDSDFVAFLQPQVVKGRRLSGEDSMDSFLVVKKARDGQMEGRVLYHWQPHYHRFVEVEDRYG